MMDAKAILERSKDLTKAASTPNASPEVIKGILNDLKRGVSATEEVLRSTRIGVTVNKLKNFKNREIAGLASEIVRKWRDEVEAKRDNGARKPQGRGGITSPSGTASPAPSSDTPTKSQAPPIPNVPLDKRTQKTDKMEVKPTGNATRDRCAGLIYDGLAFMSADAPKSILTTASAIEATIHAQLGPEEKEAYKTKVRSLYQNLKNKSSGALRANLLSGQISADRLVNMSHDELKSAERRAEDKDLERENMRMAQAPQEEKSISTSLQCSKCGQKKVSYTQAQTRSADEPMTTFCECLNCGKRWKFS